MLYVCCLCCVCFFFKQKTAYEMRISDWTSDVCSSDLAAHRRRQEAARDLVHALGAGLERRQSFAQAVFDALVVAGLEVQSRQLPERAPVASVQRVRAAQAQRAGDRLAVVFELGRAS